MNLDFVRDSLGNFRPLGLIPPMMGSAFPVGVFATPIVSPSDWVEFDFTSHPKYPLSVKDQNGRGACNGHATATAMELARFIHGQPHVSLSGWFPYAILCGGWDRGSSISEALALIEKTGLAPEDQVSYGVINPTKLSRKAYDIATNFKAEVSVALTSWEEIMSAVQLRLGGVNLSVRAGGVWSPDSEGVVPVLRGSGNHAICAGHGAKRLQDGRWAIKWQNSWTDKWGQHGYAWYTQDHWDQQSYKEAFVVRTPVENPTDDSTPPERT